jgi:DNA-binding NarL/FixJ family response regulator
MYPDTKFTATEHQLLHALCAGATNKAIARHLGKSEFTVRNQLSGLFKKISANNRTQAAGLYNEHMAQQSHKSQSSFNGTSVLLRASQN